MSNSLAIIEPGQQNDVSQKESMLKYVKDSRKLLKASGYSDRFINSIKVRDLQDANQRATNKITLSNFEKLMEDDIKKQSWISKFLNKLVLNFSSKKSKSGYTRW